MRRLYAVIFISSLISTGAFGQQSTPIGEASAFASATEIQQRLQLAISSEDYPVTPGDVYRLSYRQADTAVTTDFLVESNYVINMKVFGSLDATGMTFAALKPVVEKAVAAAYPRSMPSLVISSLGIFQVRLTGETPQSQSIVAWGLSKLSQIVETRRGPYASLRTIKIISRNGKEKTFDLFKAYRYSAVVEDPYVKPGDTIVLSLSERRVEIAGEVHRPGTYELMANEQLKELVEAYGDGLTGNSDVSLVRIQRISGDRARIIYVNLAEAYRKAASLENGDVITIPSLKESLSVVSFEGAVNEAASSTAAATGASDAAEAGVTPEYHRIIYTFIEGETLSDALRAVRGSIAPLADLSSASVLREGVAEPIVVDLRELLEKAVSPSDMVLYANDRIVIPYFRFSVFVNGAVEEPGTYPFAPGRTYQYYVALAGGSTQDAPDKIYITDVGGKMRDQTEAIQPEDRIFLIPAEIMVQGAVFLPGSFPFREGLPISYYLNLAGGIDPQRNGNRKVLHYDSSGDSSEGGRSGRVRRPSLRSQQQLRVRLQPIRTHPRDDRKRHIHIGADLQPVPAVENRGGSPRSEVAALSAAGVPYEQNGQRRSEYRSGQVDDEIDQLPTSSYERLHEFENATEPRTSGDREREGQHACAIERAHCEESHREIRDEMTDLVVQPQCAKNRFGSGDQRQHENQQRKDDDEDPAHAPGKELFYSDRYCHAGPLFSRNLIVSTCIWTGWRFWLVFAGENTT